MPIYEFFCAECNTIFNFLATRVNTTAVPACPHCQAELSRQVSIFRTRGREALPEEEGGLGPDLDEARIAKVMGELTRDMERCVENDPKQIAGIMRKFSDHAGVALGEEMAEALDKLEAGGDPEALQEEMGELFDEDSNYPLFRKKKGYSRAQPRPFRDETLYHL